MHYCLHSYSLNERTLARWQIQLAVLGLSQCRSPSLSFLSVAHLPRLAILAPSTCAYANISSRPQFSLISLFQGVRLTPSPSCPTALLHRYGRFYYACILLNGPWLCTHIYTFALQRCTHILHFCLHCCSCIALQLLSENLIINLLKVTVWYDIWYHWRVVHAPFFPLLCLFSDVIVGSIKHNDSRVIPKSECCSDLFSNIICFWYRNDLFSCQFWFTHEFDECFVFTCNRNIDVFLFSNIFRFSITINNSDNKHDGN